MCEGSFIAIWQGRRGDRKAKAAELAAKRGVPLEEAERILQAFWNDGRAAF